MKNFLKRLLKFFKNLLLLPLYCMSPDKYNSDSFERWFGEDEEDK